MKKTAKALTALAVTACMTLCGCSVTDLEDILQKNEHGEHNKPSSSSTESPSQSKPNSANPSGSTTSDSTAAPSEAGVYFSGNRGTVLSLSDDSSLNISRLGKKEEHSSGAEGVWTVLVYMCGTDLESDQGSATEDLSEMITATSKCRSLRFIVETDGTKKWQNNLCNGKTKQRFLISGGEIEELYSGKSTNMGLSSTLSDFVKWAAENCSSQYMVLDLWNHGGGSISGVCFDENFNSDSLSLKEIDEALAESFDKMTQRFEMIGCDACLMATVETANILVPYGKYAVLSQNLESGYGWDYNSFAEGVNGGASSGAEMGRYICDGYYRHCVSTAEQDDATMSVIDLSKIDAFLYDFHSFAMDIDTYCRNNSTEFIIAAKNALNFGGNNRTEGYTNMVDAGELISLSSKMSSKAEAALYSLKDCISYAKNGAYYSNACGLSLYYPLCIQGSEEIKIFKEICVSPTYLEIVDKCAYSSSTGGSLLDYISDWLSSGFWSDSDLSGNYSYWDNQQDGNLNFDQNHSALAYEIEPYLDGDGYYTFKLTEGSLDVLESVYCNVMMSYYDDWDGREYMLDLGTDDYVDMDRSTGQCRDSFDGGWFALPDGQPLCVYLIGSEDIDGKTYCNIYTSPIYLNGEYTNLKIRQTYRFNGEYYETISTDILGAWEGIDENGSAAREVYKLRYGDRIEPCYYAYDPFTFEYITDYCGDEYIYSGSGEIGIYYLYDGDYYYAFEIGDYFGNTLYTDFVMFGIEDGELFYYED